MEHGINLIGLIILISIGYFFGVRAEKRHYQSIRKREAELAELMIIQSKHIPEQFMESEGELVAANVVVSVDYFKRIIAGLRMIVGGRLTTYESLLDRGRREAILRVKQKAKSQGATAVLNIKLETASISKGEGNNVGSVEVLAYATALYNKPFRAHGFH